MTPLIYSIAFLITFLATTALTIGGTGAALVLIPMFDWLGVPLREAMATALLLNVFAMVIASIAFIKKGLVVFKLAVPMLLIGSIMSPLGAKANQFLPIPVLKWLFVAFLVFASAKVLFFGKSAPRDVSQTSLKKMIAWGCAIGAFAGFIGGLIGVGGGNIIVPLLIGLGFDPKKASATTSFIVIFTSFFGFLGFATLGNVNWMLLGVTLAACIGATILGAYLMTSRLNQSQVNSVIGWVLFVAAVKMIHSLLKSSMGLELIMAVLVALSLGFWLAGRWIRKSKNSKAV
ncbi:MAG: sulfite exporter TauE/SafE family protein [Syntrophales bacterium]